MATLTLKTPVTAQTVIDDGPEKVTASVTPPAWDPKKPFALICGIPGVYYVQGGWYFSRPKIAVSPAPEAYNPVPKKKTREEVAAAAAREVQKHVTGRFIPAEPESVMQARRENMQARIAEDQAG